MPNRFPSSEISRCGPFECETAAHNRTVLQQATFGGSDQRALHNFYRSLFRAHVRARER